MGRRIRLFHRPLAPATHALGATLVEFAIVLPLLLGLTLAIIQFGLILAQRGAVELAISDILRQIQRAPDLCTAISVGNLEAQTPGSPINQIRSAAGITLLQPEIAPGDISAVPCYFDGGAASLLTGSRQVRVRINYRLPCFACALFSLGTLPGTMAFSYATNVIPEAVDGADTCIYGLMAPLCQNLP